MIIFWMSFLGGTKFCKKCLFQNLPSLSLGPAQVVYLVVCCSLAPLRSFIDPFFSHRRSSNNKSFHSLLAICVIFLCLLSNSTAICPKLKNTFLLFLADYSNDQDISDEDDIYYIGTPVLVLSTSPCSLNRNNLPSPNSDYNLCH